MLLVSQSIKFGLSNQKIASSRLNKRKYATKQIKEQKKAQVLVIGAGTAGIGVSSLLSKTNDVLIVDPADKHYYQPAWTLVGGGLYEMSKTEKAMADVIPKGTEHLKDAVAEIQPDTNTVITTGGVEIKYDYLFVTSGLQIDWDLIKGLPEALEDPQSNVTSNYSAKYAPKTFDIVKKLKRGNAIFTHPSTPIKCGGAPQKAMYLSDSIWKEQGKDIAVDFFIGGGVVFPAEPYRQPLLDLMAKRGITPHFQEDLVEVDSKKFVATFKNLQTGELTEKKYSMLHVTPKMGAPDFVKNSKLANAAGFVDVNKNTLQHNAYPNVFSLGDSAGLPTSKTAAAISGQVPVAVKNFLSYKTGVPLIESYDGYTACPITTQKGKVLMAEFNYDITQKQETFPFIDSTKESSFNYFLKRRIFAPLYWNGLLKGRWTGPKSLPHKMFMKN
eukprot:TRINITY_DN9115_c0_g1_i1.p1 TRINITY_DN9115_c0_g1~~TRINITY_DN9115_c0_g1_i1.p1  ORF type:complete len:442 (-),score=122.08 TRINITY_DN9115_c0_g1_i1:25-1350(-)